MYYLYENQQVKQDFHLLLFKCASTNLLTLVSYLKSCIKFDVWSDVLWHLGVQCDRSMELRSAFSSVHVPTWHGHC